MSDEANWASRGSWCNRKGESQWLAGGMMFVRIESDGYGYTGKFDLVKLKVVLRRSHFSNP